MSTPPTPSPAKRLQKWLLTFLKIAIAVLGLWYVSKSLTWNDNATLPAGTTLKSLTLVDDTPVTVLNTHTDAARHMVRIQFPAQPVQVNLESPDGTHHQIALVIQNDTLIPGTTQHIDFSSVEVNETQLKPEAIPNQPNGEFIHPGLRTLLHTAGGKWPYLVGAWALLVIPFFVTAIRWRNLMRPQGIDMPLGKCLQLTFVGQFYSIILPGITGGDLVKIVYAARLTGSKTKSFITIILDRVVGLIALMVIAGTSAGAQILLNRRAGIASDNTLINVFILIAALLVVMAVGATVYFSRRLRKLVGIEWFVDHLDSATADAAEGHAKLEHLFRVGNLLVFVTAGLVIAALATLRWGVQLPWAVHNSIAIYIALGVLGAAVLAAAGGLALHAMLVERLRPLMSKAALAIVSIDDTLHVYRGHFGLLGWAFIISVASQLTLPLSAWLCGLALQMTTPITHYLAYVPVAVLAASLPISPPQGFGVMDGLLVQFFRWTARPGQSFMLVQGIRFLPLLWNLCGAYWVITGKYSRSEELAAKEPTAGGA